ncbi:MAG: S1C family serine protease [Planctomycetota bacterium]|jgi:S1-C subfamily serine protease
MSTRSAPDGLDALQFMQRVHRLDPRRRRRKWGICVAALAICALLGFLGALWYLSAAGRTTAHASGARCNDKNLSVTGEAGSPRSALPGLPPKLREKVRAAVVRIETDRGTGSGFVVDASGLVVTNYHVVRGTKRAAAVFEDQTRAEVLGYTVADRGNDVAVLRIKTNRKLTALTLSSELPSAGQRVASFSYRRGRAPTATQGEVSFTPTGRHLALWLWDLTRSGGSSSVGAHSWTSLPLRTGYAPGVKWIETTARMFPGCSGGPLANMQGEVVGMNTMIVRGHPELNYAVSSVDVGRLLRSASAECRELAAIGERRSHAAGG